MYSGRISSYITSKIHHDHPLWIMTLSIFPPCNWEPGSWPFQWAIWALPEENQGDYHQFGILGLIGNFRTFSSILSQIINFLKIIGLPRRAIICKLNGQRTWTRVIKGASHAWYLVYILGGLQSPTFESFLEVVRTNSIGKNLTKAKSRPWFFLNFKLPGHQTSILKTSQLFFYVNFIELRRRRFSIMFSFTFLTTLITIIFRFRQMKSHWFIILLIFSIVTRSAMFQILEEIRMFPIRWIFPSIEVTQRMLILYKLVKRRIDNICIK